MAFTNRSTARLAVGGALAAGLIASGGALASAEPVTDQEALDLARQTLMGATVESVEIDTSDGTPKWEVDIRTRDGGAYEAQVDARTGTVLSIDRDSD
ncbi:PepSY domain-containing protein [Nocardia sp. CDC159]|uniref:PepSY domain-containing protein n=1 Tax=Nocardia pulmonis TaxID=2951408 RepID=A0A9X2E1R0_9NOCA|nr:MULTISPECIES: PepSY domain-containing protein [Nocardia]MCM6772011.1 PepSY domain-containing protein [Nocardia pulmonis]MCM6785331.1 PepSY domain-containing protein [Nocardia sp. CDC159]